MYDIQRLRILMIATAINNNVKYVHRENFEIVFKITTLNYYNNFTLIEHFTFQLVSYKKTNEIDRIFY